MLSQAHNFGELAQGVGTLKGKTPGEEAGRVLPSEAGLLPAVGPPVAELLPATVGPPFAPAEHKKNFSDLENEMQPVATLFCQQVPHALNSTCLL